MDAINTKRMEMFIRVQESRQEFPLAVPEGSHGAELFEKLGQVIEDVRGRAYDQSRYQSSLREIFGSKSAARDNLLRLMEAIQRTARVIGYTRPGLEDKFYPANGFADQALFTLARTYATDALPLKAEFVKRGLDPDFIADLDAAAAAFDAAMNERSQEQVRQVAATAEIDKLIEKGLRVVREIGVIVRNVYADDPVKLALWQSTSHVEKPPRRARSKSGENQPPPS